LASRRTGPGEDFDPALPLLNLVFDLTAVGELFGDHWRKEGPREGTHVSVRARKLQDVKYQPGLRCICTYELSVDSGNGKPALTVGVIEVDRQGARAALPHEDLVLDRLGEALDPERMQGRLEHLPGLKAVLTRPPRITALRYKPRLRCALRYDLSTRRGDQVLFGKMLAEDGERTMSTLCELDKLSHEVPAMPRIAPPLIFWADLKLLLQQAVDGEEFHSVVFDERMAIDARVEWMRRAGERLAGLHSNEGPPGPVRSLTDDVEELVSYVAPMAAADAGLARSYEEGVERVASSTEDSAPVPSHGAFRTDQFMIQGGDLVLIDLDGYCRADPARDIGNLLAYLRWKTIRQPHHGPFIDRATISFLEGYGSGGGSATRKQISSFEAASLLKIAGRRYRSLTWKEWPLIPRLIDDCSVLLGS
jgi:hypothetical protein